jgi:hypothetical protein
METKPKLTILQNMRMWILRRLVVRMQGAWNLLRIMSSGRLLNGVDVLSFATITLAGNKHIKYLDADNSNCR